MIGFRFDFAALREAGRFVFFFFFIMSLLS